MGKSTTHAMSFEDVSFHKPLAKGSVKKMLKERNITEMDTFQILTHLFGRHWKLLAFAASISLNVLYVVKHFGLA